MLSLLLMMMLKMIPRGEVCLCCYCRGGDVERYVGDVGRYVNDVEDVEDVEDVRDVRRSMSM